jgi:hypothetical protein
MRFKQRKPNKVNLFCCFLFDYIRSIALSVLLSVIKMYIIILLRTVLIAGAHIQKKFRGVSYVLGPTFVVFLFDKKRQLFKEFK